MAITAPPPLPLPEPPSNSTQARIFKGVQVKRESGRPAPFASAATHTIQRNASPQPTGTDPGYTVPETMEATSSTLKTRSYAAAGTSHTDAAAPSTPHDTSAQVAETKLTVLR